MSARGYLGELCGVVQYLSNLHTGSCDDAKMASGSISLKNANTLSIYELVSRLSYR